MYDRSLPELRFLKSSFCVDCTCVEVAVLPDGVAIRDSKDTRADAPVLQFTHDEWAAFLQGVRADEFSHTALLAATR
jgi:hypothetical protein